jgi:UDP-2,3-diacylglucosamine hydrolase
MSSKPIYLTGDIHLGVVPPQTETAFLSWLHHCGQAASKVIINGDLFDFWFEYGSVIPRGHTRVLGALAALVDAGIPVVLMGGNHDWWGGSYLREEVGLEFHQDPVILDLQGRKTLLAHGDGLGRGDLGYRFLRFLLRGTATRFAFRWLLPDLGVWVARHVSRTDERSEEPSEKLLARARFLEDWAEKRLKALPELDLVVLGHTHFPTVREVEPERYYLNAGDWVTHRSYGLLESGRPPQILDWE